MKTIQYVQAIRHARRRQLAARALRPINRRRTRFSAMPRAFRAVGGPEELWRSAAFSTVDNASELLPDGQVEVLGRIISYPLDARADSSLERLRAFHLHYGEEILGCARRGNERYLAAARRGLAAWIRANPPAATIGWHPYPLSTRIGNWIAAGSLEPSLATAGVCESLWSQLEYLERNVEDDILGNHVIRNSRALVLGGVAFDEPRLLERGLELLSRELPEQVLPDGGHYERSPVYHGLVLRDLLEIQAAIGTGEFDPVIDRMKTFAAWLTRPDGRPALFNDGGLDLAPDLREYLPQPESGLALFPNTGYAVIRNGTPLWLALDCGLAAPAFLPPHAHADALSFQLWLGGKPVIVDPGSFTYDAGPERDWFRSTRAHSTVAVDGLDQFEFVGPFRAIGIPPVQIVEATGSDREGTVAAELKGFTHVARGLTHRRRLDWSPRRISVEDEIDGHGRHLIESSLPLPPSTSIEGESQFRANGVVIEALGTLRPMIEERWVSERFFERSPAPAIVARRKVTLPAKIGWNLQLPEGP